MIIVNKIYDFYQYNRERLDIERTWRDAMKLAGFVSDTGAWANRNYNTHTDQEYIRVQLIVRITTPMSNDKQQQLETLISELDCLERLKYTHQDLRIEYRTDNIS